MELRVGGEGILGLGVGELTGAGEGGYRKRGESRMVKGEGRIEEVDRRWRLKEEEHRSEGLGGVDPINIHSRYEMGQAQYQPEGCGVR
jgi:hypothetical protein